MEYATFPSEFVVGLEDGSWVGSMLGEEDGSNDGNWVGAGVNEDLGTQPHRGFVKTCNELQCCAST